MKKLYLFGIIFILFANLFASISFTASANANSIGNNIRSDGEYLYMCMEDGIKPHWKETKADHTLDYNSTIEGKYCENITYNYADSFTEGVLNEIYTFDNPLKPDAWSIKLNIKFTNDTFTRLSLQNTFGTTLCDIRFLNTGTIQSVTTATYPFTMKWKTNTTYTITFSDIDWTGHTADVTISNATASETISNVPFSVTPPTHIYRFTKFMIGGGDTATTKLFIDDWTVGQQTLIDSNDATNIKATNATANGLIVNDGSTLQNDSQKNLTAKIFYDTKNHSDLQFIMENGTIGSANYSFNDPYAICSNGDYLWIGDSGNDRVVKRWASNLTYITKNGTSGSGNSQYGYITGICTDGIYLWITDQTNDRVVKRWASNLTYISKATISEAGQPSGICYDGTYIYISTNDKYISKRWASNLTYITKSSQLSVGANLYSLATNGFYIYAITYSDYILRIDKSTLANMSSVYVNDLSFFIYANESSPYIWITTSDIMVATFSSTIQQRMATDMSLVREYDIGKATYSTSNAFTINDKYLYVLDTDLGAVQYSLRKHFLIHNESYPFNQTVSGNFTGENTGGLKGLTPGQLYFYRAYGETNYTNASSYGWGEEKYFLTKPEAPTNPKYAVNLTTMKLNLSWINGTGSNRTVVLMKTTGMPTSHTDGTIIYNGTTNYTLYTFTIGTTYYFKAFGYKNWSFNPNPYQFSDNGTAFVIGGLWVNCYDETTHENLTFNIKVSNQSGSQVYENTSCTNTHFINASLCPHGSNIQSIISATGYQQRIYTFDIYPNIFYILNAYLPKETAPGNGTETCELRPYIDSKMITDPTVDATITLTYALEDVISVELYNKSLYGTYGGWIFVTSDNYTATTTQVIIEHEIMDVNTTMVRVNYYYEFCTGGIESALYYLRVVETIDAGDTEIDRAVENVKMIIKKYVNVSGIFVEVSSIFTDANGYVNIYLIPDVHYKIFLNKSGYTDVIGADYIPAPPNVYGQTNEKTFRIIKISGDIPPNIYNPLQVITFNGYVNRITHILYVNYSDSLCATIDVNISIYEFNSSTNLSSLFGYCFKANNCSFQCSFNNINDSNRYVVVLHLNHTYFGYDPQSFAFNPIVGWLALIIYTTPGYMNSLWNANYGTNPIGWSNCIMFILMVFGIFFGGKDELPLIFIALGVIFQLINGAIGFYTFTQAAASIIPIAFIIAGILAAWQQYRG